MTNKQINIAIAEHCGWRHEVLEPADTNKIWLLPSDLPDYCNDLNAIHEVEMYMRGSDYEFYNDPQRNRMFNEYQYHLMSRFGASATAKERAEAFLKIIGKWKN